MERLMNRKASKRTIPSRCKNMERLRSMRKTFMSAKGLGFFKTLWEMVALSPLPFDFIFW